MTKEEILRIFKEEDAAATALAKTYDYDVILRTQYETEARTWRQARRMLEARLS
jgi:hypothetical protein